MTGENAVPHLSGVFPLDLLEREERPILTDETRAYYRNKTILVTGGGGSVGSAICREIVTCHPRRLVIFDIYENNAYDLCRELCATYDTDVVVEIGSVRDMIRLRQTFRRHKPDVVFHAAAHKHVALMEASPAEAIKNNVMGTRNTVEVSVETEVSSFILVSTDKAVRPTGVMGASKRLCEMIVLSAASDRERFGNTVFSAVRFGNVMGSNGSVVPLFARQIASGGPVTLTDRRVTRYFMTLREAAQLLMTAGAMARSGDLFVLDMGQPVSILSLAEHMIRREGLEPGVDIAIREIGLLPGEKLYEEPLDDTESLRTTAHDLIYVDRSSEHMYSAATVKAAVEDVCHALHSVELLNMSDLEEDMRGRALIIAALQRAVPEYLPADIHGMGAESTAIVSVIKYPDLDEGGSP